VTGARVIVVGSGAAGLSASLAAATAGRNVVLLERDDTVGGTTALSGGVVWMPANDAMTALGIDDSASEACRYLEGLATGDVDHTLITAFASDAGRVATEIEKRTPLCWEVLEHWPDYRGEIPGALSGGRSLWPRALTLPADIDVLVHRALDQPSQPSPAGARNDGVVFRGPVRGRALVGALLAGVRDAGVEVRTGVRVTGLAMERDVVTGVRMGADIVDGRVILACGGFQHDSGLAAHLNGAPVAAMGTPACDGDGLRMARSVGAAVGNMEEGWWMPALQMPGEELDGAPHYRALHSERAYPGAIMVDGAGRRFVDEAQNYGDVGRSMAGLATRARATATAPCWLLFDGTCRRRYPVGPLGPGDPDPHWLHRADDIAALAAAIGVPAGTLCETVATFNGGAERGSDLAFGRGSFPYDVWIGDPKAPHPTLAPLAAAPFYALEVHLGCMGTKGGPRTDDRGRVLSEDSSVVAGLYAVGNVAANPFGTATPAGGSTLGPALVFGFRAGEAAASDR